MGWDDSSSYITVECKWSTGMRFGLDGRQVEEDETQTMDEKLLAKNKRRAPSLIVLASN